MHIFSQSYLPKTKRTANQLGIETLCHPLDAATAALRVFDITARDSLVERPVSWQPRSAGRQIVGKRQ
jgi:hypothetical protein